MPAARARAVLLIQTAFIGDVILATSLLEYLHRTQPNTPVDFLVRKGNESLLQGHPHVRRVLVWDKKKDKYRGLWGLLRQIRQARYGRVVTLQRFASTGFLTALSGAPERVGFDKNPFAWGFTRAVPHVIGDGRHEVARNLALLGNSEFGIMNSEVGSGHSAFPQTQGNSEFRITNSELSSGNSSLSVRPRLYPTPADEAAAAQAAGRAGGGPYICVAPTSVWFTKQFPEEQWLKLLAALPPQYTVFLLGGPPDAEACALLLARSPRPNVVNLAGQLSLVASAALMRGAVLNYVNDSAPMHLCSAVDAPTCAVYCSTVPAFGFGPLSSFARVVEVPHALECRPCGLHGYQACPLGHFRCAHDIHTSQLLAVLAEAEAVI
ncbi:glycosyltransferase family 9 protein [Hymenobacter guriensis]|uniref:Glycosyltransferase family 9 protein n=1 Tax=Hymenobacter guriensis TaxID=2793065 RepID=A0ABS0L015_9BACT|nr:glycosyltransferase family 9 protein [Hymenobacter guriensis]MBG8552722.1 glycosyltransferase family 9 protein [Hymenobacter guriensis]